MTEAATKNKIAVKKLNAPPNTELETFLKNQKNNMSNLKAELKSVISRLQLSDCETAERDKRIVELEQSLNERNAEIVKLSGKLDQVQEEKAQILLEFNTFKENFFQLEIEYDRNLNQQKQDNENLLGQLQQQQNIENQEIHELTLKCNDLQQRLQVYINDFGQVNRQYMETLQKFERMKQNFEQQQKEFEFYKKQVDEDKKLYEEKYKHDCDNLREECRQKDEIIKQCITDKNEVEKQKSLLIDELNNKIHRIQTAFSQPTRVVQPIMNLPQQQINNFEINSNSDSSDHVVAISKLQESNPMDKPSVTNSANNENQKAEQNPKQRSYKFKRPVHPTTSSQISNVVANNTANRKRRSQPLRELSAMNNCKKSSLSSSDEGENIDSDYNKFCKLFWRPNSDCYVTDTDASEGFNNVKSFKK